MSETFSEICAEFIGKPYSESGIGPDSYGCLGFCYAFLKRSGKPVNDADWSYNGLTLQNYMESWKQNNKIDKLLIEAFDRIGQAVPIKKKLAGDLLVIQEAGGSMFPAMFAGNNNCIASFSDRGVIVFSCSKATIIIQARRL